MRKYRKVSPYLYSVDPSAAYLGERPKAPMPTHPAWPPVDPSLRRAQLRRLHLPHLLTV